MTDPDYTGPGYIGPCHHLRPFDGSRRLVVFFGAKDLSFERYNFFQTGRELSEHCLFVNNGVNHWYQHGVPGLGDSVADTVAQIHRWAHMLNAQEIITIGTSMGGYGAIQYGAALQAHMPTRVLAFSTDAQLASPHSQSARHYVADIPPSCPDLCALLTKTPVDVALLVGERDAVDLHSAWQLAQIAGVQVTSLVGVDHVVPSHLARRARLVPLLRSLVADKGVPHQPDAGAALTHAGYVEHSFEAFTAAEKQDWPTCETAARTALESYPFGEAASLLLGKALIKKGAFAQAVEALAPCVASQPEDTDAKFLLGQALRHCGASAQARQLYQQIVVQKPDMHRSWYAMGIMTLETGDLVAAANSVRRALRLAPRIKAYKDRLKQIEAQIKAAKASK